MKKHKRKARRKDFTILFLLTLIALALLAYGLLCWRETQIKILEGRWQSTHDGEQETVSGAGESPAPSTLLHESEVMPYVPPAFNAGRHVMPEVRSSGKASHKERVSHLFHSYYTRFDDPVRHETRTL